MSLIDSIISQLRVPDLPYPVTRQEHSEAGPWRDFLASAWAEQTDDTVIDRLRASEITWTVRQVNSAYLADRIMSVFLRKSGVHPVLISHAARLRFWLALDLEQRGESAVDRESPIRRWLDSLELLKGWSRTGGRSDRWVLDHLSTLESAVTRAFEEQTPEAVEQCVTAWLRTLESQNERAHKVSGRLWQTERGAAQQRAAENAVRAAVARACRGRSLPVELVGFVEAYWRGILRQIVMKEGLKSDQWRHAHRLLEWLIWVGDPQLSDQDRNRLYQVGEQLLDKVEGLVTQVTGKSPESQHLSVVERLLTARLREEPLTMITPEVGDADPRWLEPVADEDKAQAQQWLNQWYLREEEGAEVRQYFFAFLEETGEVLWTNEQGAKLALQSFQDVKDRLERGELRHLPPLYSFGHVLKDTLSALHRVLESQKKQRERAEAKARAEAEALRRQQEEERREQQRLEQARQAQEETERAQALEDAARRDKEEAEASRAEEEKALLEVIDRMEAGSWIELREGEEKKKLKLALRIRASGKMVFVDRLGLNRQEINRLELMALVREERARLLSGGAEFEDTLSRVVGRLRVGR